MVVVVSTVPALFLTTWVSTRPSLSKEVFSIVLPEGIMVFQGSPRVLRIDSVILFSGVAVITVRSLSS